MAEGRMRVRATRTGYYDLVRRREGDVFDIAAEPKNEKTGKPMAFSEVWMEPVAATTRPRVTTSQQALKAQNDQTKRDNQLARANEGVDEAREPVGSADVLFKQ